MNSPLQFPGGQPRTFISLLQVNTAIARTLKEDQPLRLLLNVLFFHFDRSEPTYKSQRIKLLDVIAVCNQLKMNSPSDIYNLFLGEISQI